MDGKPSKAAQRYDPDLPCLFGKTVVPWSLKVQFPDFQDCLIADSSPTCPCKLVEGAEFAASLQVIIP